MAPPFLNYAQVGGTSPLAGISVEYVSYIRTDPKNPARCVVGSYAVNGEPLHLEVAPGALASALGLSVGYVVPGQPFAPFAELPMVSGGFVYVRAGTTAYVRADPKNTLRSYINTHSQGPEGPWHILDSLANTEAALLAADPGGGPSPAPTVDPFWAWEAGSGYAQFGAPINHGWDVTPATYGTTSGAFIGAQEVSFEGDATVDSISVRPMLATIPQVGGLRRGVITGKVHLEHGPLAAGIASGFGVLNVGAEHGLFVAVRIDGTQQVIWDVLRWDGAASMQSLLSTNLGTRPANVAEVWVRVSFEVELRPPGAPPRVAMLCTVDALGDGYGSADLWESSTYVSDLGAVGPDWNGVDLDQCAWFQSARDFPTFGAPFTSTSRAGDIGVWPRIEGGLLAPV